MEQVTKKSTTSWSIRSMTAVLMGTRCRHNAHADANRKVRNTICSAALVFRQNPAFWALNHPHISTPSRYSKSSKNDVNHCFENILFKIITLPTDHPGRKKRLPAAPPLQGNFLKKFLLQKHRFITGNFHENATKFGKLGAIFHQNTAVSCAATSSTECQMLRQNRTAISRFVPTSVCANAAHRSTTSAFHLHTVVGVR
jgi:hypothetical protein